MGSPGLGRPGSRVWEARPAEEVGINTGEMAGWRGGGQCRGEVMALAEHSRFWEEAELQKGPGGWACCWAAGLLAGRVSWAAVPLPETWHPSGSLADLLFLTLLGGSLHGLGLQS